MSKNSIHSYEDITDEQLDDICSDFNPFPSVIPHKSRVIAIGDIHGDMNLAINFLKKAKVIKEICKSDLNETQITEYEYKLQITNKLYIETKTENFDFERNNSNIVYRYYKSDNDYYVKVNQDNNNPNDVSTDEEKQTKCKLFDIDRWFKWIGKDTYVVQVGDQVDRCRPYGDHTCDIETTTKNDEDSDLEIMLFYDSLDKIAIESGSGGRVFSLLGNHEIMNIGGDMRYVSNKGGKEYSPDPKNYTDGIKIRKKVFSNTISRKMACSRSTILIIGDYLFVHGGIANKLAFKYKLIDINLIIKKFLLSFKSNDDVNYLLHSSRSSPLWYRQLAYIPQDINGKKDKNCSVVFDPVIKTINSNNPTIQIKGMVIGHTPQFSVFGKGITTACNDSVIRVDIGASTAFDVFSADSKSTNPDIDIQKAREPQVVEIRTNLDTKESTVQILI